MNNSSYLSSDEINHILLSSCYSSSPLSSSSPKTNDNNNNNNDTSTIYSTWSGIPSPFPIEGNTEELLENLFRYGFASTTATSHKTNILRILSLSCHNGLGIEIPLLSTIHMTRRLEKYSIIFHGVDHHNQYINQFYDYIHKEYPTWYINCPYIRNDDDTNTINKLSSTPATISESNNTITNILIPKTGSQALHSAKVKLTVAQALASVSASRRHLDLGPNKYALSARPVIHKKAPYQIKLWKFSSMENFFVTVQQQHKKLETPSQQQFLSTYDRITKLFDSDIDALISDNSTSVSSTIPPNKLRQPLDPSTDETNSLYWGKYHLIILNHNLSFYPLPFNIYRDEDFLNSKYNLSALLSGTSTINYTETNHPIRTNLQYIFQHLLHKDGILLILHRQGNSINYIRNYTLHMLYEYIPFIQTTIPNFHIPEPLYTNTLLEKILKYQCKVTYTTHSISGYINTTNYIVLLEKLLLLWSTTNNIVSVSTLSDPNTTTNNTTTNTMKPFRKSRLSRTDLSDNPLTIASFSNALSSSDIDLLTILIGMNIQPLWNHCLRYISSLIEKYPINPFTNINSTSSIIHTKDIWIFECMIKVLLIIDIASIHHETITIDNTIDNNETIPATTTSSTTSYYRNYSNSNNKIALLNSKIPVPSTLYIIKQT